MMWKDMIEPKRPQIAIEYGAETMQFPSRIIKARIQAHAHNV
jgi:hypothetical protein